MKDLDLREIPQLPAFDKFFIGRILQVDTGNMVLKVELQDIPGVLDMSLPFQYVSDISGGYMMYVPIEGDYVVVGMKQGGDWEIVGHRLGFVKRPEDGLSSWGAMRESDEHVKPPALQKGDFGIGVRGLEDENAVEFLMLTDGRMILSAGAVYMFFNQQENSLKQIVSHFASTSGKMTQHFGEARVIMDKTEKAIPGEQLWRVKQEEKSEEIALGYVNRDGVAEKSSSLSPIRYKVKIGDTEILIDQAGGIEINAKKNIFLKVSETGEQVKIENTEVNLTADSFNIVSTIDHEGDRKQKGNVEHEGDTTRKGNIEHEGNLKQKGNVEHEGDTTRKGNIEHEGNLKQIGKVDISGTLSVGSKVTAMAGGDVGGVVGLVLETVLPLLASHTHMYVSPGGPAPTAPSVELAAVGTHKTFKLKGG